MLCACLCMCTLLKTPSFPTNNNPAPVKSLLRRTNNKSPCFLFVVFVGAASHCCFETNGEIISLSYANPSAMLFVRMLVAKERAERKKQKGWIEEGLVCPSERNVFALLFIFLGFYYFFCGGWGEQDIGKWRSRCCAMIVWRREKDATNFGW